MKDMSDPACDYTREALEDRIKWLSNELAGLRLSRKCAMDRDRRSRPPFFLSGYMSSYEALANTIDVDIQRCMLDLENVRESLRYLEGGCSSDDV